MSTITSDQVDIIFQGCIAAAKQAGHLMMENIAQRQTGMIGGLSSVETKSSPADFVTEVDTKCDEVIISYLKKVGADAKLERFGFLTEESLPDAPVCDAEPFFCVDPIDGTTSFLHGLPDCCVSIAFCVKREPIVGVVFIPMMNELVAAVKGRGAFLNGIPIRKRGHAASTAPTKISNALMCYHLPAQRSQTRLDTSLGIVRELLELGAHSVRCYGSAAIDCCNVALGRADCYLELGINSWDIAAGLIILAESNCCSLDLTDDSAGDEKTPKSLATVRNGKMGLVAAATPELCADSWALAMKHGLCPEKYFK